MSDARYEYQMPAYYRKRMRIRRRRVRFLFVSVLCLLSFLLGWFLKPTPSEADRTITAGSTDPVEETVSGTVATVDINNLPWNLILANFAYPIPNDPDIDLKSLLNGESVDARIYPSLKGMLDDMSKIGLDPIVCSSFRTWETQEYLYNNRIQEYMADGYSKSDAIVAAGRWVAIPGTSEHQLGLAVDIVDAENQHLDESQMETKVFKWLEEHCHEYGFILRYPPAKSHITGIEYEPWHFRYVGIEAASEIMSRGICLEEYLGILD